MHPNPPAPATTAPPAPAPGAPGRAPGRTPLYLSGLALILAVVAAIVSLVALARTGDRPAAAPAPVAAPTTAPADNTSPTVDPTTDPSTEPTAEQTDGPDPRGVYTVAYQQETLRLQPSTTREVDLDEPSADARTGTSELSYTGYVTELKLEFRDVGLAEIKTPSPTANDCVEELRRAPIDLSVAPSKGQQLCVLTSADAAANQGIRQKVVLVRIDGITADGTLNLTATAWVVPR